MQFCSSSNRAVLQFCSLHCTSFCIFCFFFGNFPYLHLSELRASVRQYLSALFAAMDLRPFSNFSFTTERIAYLDASANSTVDLDLASSDTGLTPLAAVFGVLGTFAVGQ